MADMFRCARVRRTAALETMRDCVVPLVRACTRARGLLIRPTRLARLIVMLVVLAIAQDFNQPLDPDFGWSFGTVQHLGGMVGGERLGCRRALEWLHVALLLLVSKRSHREGSAYLVGLFVHCAQLASRPVFRSQAS